MDIKTLWRDMTSKQQQAFAKRASTTALYIERHLIQSPPSRIPTPRLIDGLHNASNGMLTKAYLYAHFYEHDRVIKPRDEKAFS